MATIYKEKILKEIEKIPEKHLKSIYNIIHLFKSELNMATKKKCQNRNSGRNMEGQPN
jgi:hypothetical protein